MFSVRSHARWVRPLAAAGLLSVGAVPALACDQGSTDTRATASATTLAPPAVAAHDDDFNGDGYQDLAVGAPKATVAGKAKAGYVAVMYGGPHGLSPNRRTVITRSTDGIPGSATAGQGFGTQLSLADLNGDGRTDLVIGIAARSGDAVVVWGGSRGLTGDSTSIPATNTQAGDFDGDGKADLALFRTGASAGDDPLGTTATVWTGPVGRGGTPAAKTALDPDRLRSYDVVDGATGDVDGDGRDELALRVYCGDGVYCTRFYTPSATGLTNQEAAIPQGDGDVALGDLNGDGYDDVAVGLTYDERVQVAYGSAAGVTPSTAWKSYSQNTPGVPGTGESNEGFGTALATGDINGDGIDDLAVGAPGEELGYDDGAGAVDILRGSRTGLTGTGAQAFTQDTRGIPGTAELYDSFGATVHLLDTNGNGHADLAVAAPGEDTGNGAVWLLRGRPTGLVTDAALAFGGRRIGAPYAKAGFGYELN